MIILGIDPGTATTGYGIIEKKDGKLKCLEYGCVKTSKQLEFSDRLERIYKEISGIIKKWKPKHIAIEDLYFFKNEKTAFKVGQARGVVMLVAKQNKLPIYEPTPLQVKQAVSGYGKADKVQVQKMVKLILNLSEEPKPDDAADALAIAISAANCIDYKSKIKNQNAK